MVQRQLECPQRFVCWKCGPRVVVLRWWDLQEVRPIGGWLGLCDAVPGRDSCSSCGTLGRSLGIKIHSLVPESL